MRYFLGADVGGTKTHVLIADEAGRALGLGASGSGNHESVGYDGLRDALTEALREALAVAQLSKAQISGAGFGIAGYDWPGQREPVLKAIAALNLTAPVSAVNDALLGVLAGTTQGWGIAVVSGTGCNCWGRDQPGQRFGQMTGGGLTLGEGAGATELIARAIQAVAHAWTKRGPPTQLTEALVHYTQVHDVSALLQDVMSGKLALPARAAPLVFETARSGDEVAQAVIHWAGVELGEMVKAVVRQLHFETLAFEVVLVGGLFNGGELLSQPLRETVMALAPQARFVRLSTPPVVGAVLLGMELFGLTASAPRESLIHSTRQLLNGASR